MFVVYNWRHTATITYNAITESKHSFNDDFDDCTVAFKSFKKQFLSSANKSGGWLCSCVIRKQLTGLSSGKTARARHPDFAYFAQIKYLQICQIRKCMVVKCTDAFLPARWTPLKNTCMVNKAPMYYSLRCRFWHCSRGRCTCN